MSDRSLTVVTPIEKPEDIDEDQEQELSCSPICCINDEDKDRFKCTKCGRIVQ